MDGKATISGSSAAVTAVRVTEERAAAFRNGLGVSVGSPEQERGQCPSASHPSWLSCFHGSLKPGHVSVLSGFYYSYYSAEHSPFPRENSISSLSSLLHGYAEAH